MNGPVGFAALHTAQRFFGGFPNQTGIGLAIQIKATAIGPPRNFERFEAAREHMNGGVFQGMVTPNPPHKRPIE
jgi:hypothetical protein